MTRKEEMINELRELLQYGYDVYVPIKDDRYWAMVTTPKGSLLYVQLGYYGGYDIAYSYVPSKKCGVRCSARNGNDDPYDNLSLETMEIAENRGLTFAHKLKATLYASVEQALNDIWDFDNYFKLEKEGCK